jgi:hypothetical protein
MTRLRPLAVPAAAVVLATGTPSASAQQSRPVVQPASCGLQSTVPADDHLDPGSGVALVPSATPLPPAVLVAVVEPGATGVRYAAAPIPAGAVAAGPPLVAAARGPPA